MTGELPLGPFSKRWLPRPYNPITGRAKSLRFRLAHRRA